MVDGGADGDGHSSYSVGFLSCWGTVLCFFYFCLETKLILAFFFPTSVFAALLPVDVSCNLPWTSV